MLNKRTIGAMEERKALIARFGLSQHESFISVATELIRKDNLYADIPQTRQEAINFLDTYHSISKYRSVKPLPGGWMHSDG